MIEHCVPGTSYSLIQRRTRLAHNSQLDGWGTTSRWKEPSLEVHPCAGGISRLLELPVIICTDGVTEAPNSRGEEYGEARLTEVIQANRGLPVNELLGVIQASVQDFSGPTQADDITLIVACCS